MNAPMFLFTKGKILAIIIKTSSFLYLHAAIFTRRNRSTVDLPDHKAPVMRAFEAFFLISLHKLLNKQSSAGGVRRIND